MSIGKERTEMSPMDEGSRIAPRDDVNTKLALLGQRVSILERERRNEKKAREIRFAKLLTLISLVVAIGGLVVQIWSRLGR